MHSCKKNSNFAIVEVRTIVKKGREEKVWFAIRVTYNRELRVKEDLDARGITNFVPMQYRREERHGVIKANEPGDFSLNEAINSLANDARKDADSSWKKKLIIGSILGACILIVPNKH